MKDIELAALTEFCTIGMGHAATALSQLMGKPVCIEVPRLLVLDADGLAELLHRQQVTGLHLQILGKVRGSIVILLVVGPSSAQGLRQLTGERQATRPEVPR